MADMPDSNCNQALTAKAQSSVDKAVECEEKSDVANTELLNCYDAIYDLEQAVEALAAAGSNLTFGLAGFNTQISRVEAQITLGDDDYQAAELHHALGNIEYDKYCSNPSQQRYDDTETEYDNALEDYGKALTHYDSAESRATLLKIDIDEAAQNAWDYYYEYFEDQGDEEE